MNSILNDDFLRNRALFRARFPELARLIGLDSDALTGTLVSGIPENYALVPTPSGIPTVSVRGIFLQSRYDPARDAERAFAELRETAAHGCVFAGLGLALVPELYAKAFPSGPVIIAEPDIFLFLLCLAARPLDALFSHPNLVFLVGTTPGEVCAFLEKLDFLDLPVHENPAITGANKPWFDEFSALRKRNRSKREINANTLRRFGDLWLSNMCRNLGELRERDGIDRFAGAFEGFPVLVLAAGPSLDRILPVLGELRKRCVIIAVDTAVRACARVGVEPDFIILVDPQYWNARHLDGISCPSSILVTESAAWPSVFRFPCRNIFLCASLFPLGRFLENRTGKRGELGAGGSVSTTAWDFARHLGSRNIVMAGLDLGFPDLKTHFTGSIFEDRTHTVSNRLSPAETAGYLALYGAGPYPVSDYRGGTVLTDKRLILYAWWFESRLAQYPENRTSTLTPEGVKIPGFAVMTETEARGWPEIRESIDRRLAELASESASGSREERRMLFDRALEDLAVNLADLGTIAERGLALCRKFEGKGLTDNGRAKILAEMDALDRTIIRHEAKEITAMVFREVNEKTDAGAIDASKAMYRSIRDAARKNMAGISDFIKELKGDTDTYNVG